MLQWVRRLDVGLALVALLALVASLALAPTGAPAAYNQPAAVAKVLPGYISGLILSNDGTTPNTVLDIAGGTATSDDGAVYSTLSSAFTKSISSNWAVGSGSGGLDTGTAQASYWYHVFLIQRIDTGVVDVVFSASATGPTMPSGYTKKRRIGAFKLNGSTQIVAFLQSGNEFLWAAPVNDANAVAVSTTASLLTISTPPGIKTTARVRLSFSSTAANQSVLIGSPDVSDISGVIGGNSTMYASASGFIANNTADIRTSTSAQVRASASTGSPPIYVTTYGWIDPRGAY